MSARTQNWIKFGGLVILAFALGLLFAGLLDLPSDSSAQERAGAVSVIPAVQPPNIPAARSLMDLSDAFAAVAEQVQPSVVFIKAQHTARAHKLPPGMEQFFPRFRQDHPQVEQGSGSGFIVSPDGYILTNNHVVEGSELVTVRLFDRREFKAKVLGTDPYTDVAVLKIEAHGLKPVALGNSDDARVGEWVLAVGNPLGDALTFTVTSGIVSAKGRALAGLPNRSNASIQDFIQTDAAINPGNSGGPLVNVRGEVIGINAAIASETGFYSGYGFAIPINLVRTVMEQLIKTGKVQRAQLGILVADATATDAAYVGLPDIRGVKVQDFASDASPARRAGLEAGDIIVSVDGKQVEYTAQLQQAVGFRSAGDVVKVEVARKGGIRKVFNVKLTAQDFKSDSAKSEQAPPDDAGATGGATIDPLGISIIPLTPDLAQRYQLPDDLRGLVVTNVQPNGPAWEVLFDEDRGGPDIITAVEGKPVRTEADLRKALKDAGSAGIVTLQLYDARRDVRRIERIKLGGTN